MFPTEFEAILERIAAVEPEKYGRTRNFIDGDVTRLSPYISRGVISTKMVMDHVLEKGYDPSKIEKFLQELAWRDYWQQIWIEKRNAINTDLRQEQSDVDHHELPTAILQGTTGVQAVDDAIHSLYEIGYMHNHVRMYTAAITCNMGKSHWKIPAKWMYYHLLDGDWASNALSWQWVAGSNSNKKYVANQENINKYCHTQQKETFLDVPYDTFHNFQTPEVLKDTEVPALKTPLPAQKEIKIDPTQPTYVYTSYNLDPQWDTEVEANRILLLEPSHFDTYPISQNVLDFILKLSQNISGIQIFVGEFDTLKNSHELGELHYKEHPLSQHFSGTEHPRDWMFDVTGYYRSFFAFWKKCKKQL